MSESRNTDPWSKICPECHASETRIYKRGRGFRSKYGRNMPTYHCRACGSDFDRLAHASERPSSRPAWY